MVQLGAEKDGRGDECRRRQAYLSADRSGQSPRRSPGAQKQRFLSTSSSASYVKPLLASSTRRGDSARGRSPFRQALDEAKETLAGTRASDGRSRVLTASAQASPAWQTHLSVQDESAKVSVAYDEAQQAPSGRGYSARKSGAKGRGGEYSVEELKSTPPRRKAEVEDDELRRTVPDSKSSPRGGRISEERRAPRQEVSIETKRGDSYGKAIKVCLKLNNGIESRASNEEKTTGEPNWVAKASPIRRTVNALSENRHGSKQERGTRGYESPEELRRRKNTESPRSQRAGGEKCFEDTSGDMGVEGEERHVAGEVRSNSSNDYDGQNRSAVDARTEETEEEDPNNQRRWCNRGRVLWSTYAEPAGRRASVGTRPASPNTVRPQSEPVMRPYHGLYERSLRANGMDPTNFRTSRCCGGSNAGFSCAVQERRRHIDCSLLWRGNGGSGFAAERVRAPVDGLPDRLEAGRILDSFNRRAELLGTTSPTPLRAKAAWMENPGDPEYRYVEEWKASAA